VVDLLILDIETYKSDRLPEYCDIFDKAKLEQFEEKKKNNPKARKPELKSEKATLHCLTAKVVCVGLKEFGSDEDPMVKFSLDEREVLEWVRKNLILIDPEAVIAYNGEEFDVPMLKLMALSYGINLQLPYKVIDPYKILGMKWSKPIQCSLEELAWKLGCRGDAYGRGDQVENWIESEQFEEVVRHCRGDVLMLDKICRQLESVGII